MKSRLGHSKTNRKRTEYPLCQTPGVFWHYRGKMGKTEDGGSGGRTHPAAPHLSFDHRSHPAQPQGTLTWPSSYNGRTRVGNRAPTCQKIGFALGTLPTELKGVSYWKGLSMLVPWLLQPKMAEKDKHINHGDRVYSLYLESFSAFEGKKAFRSLNCSTNVSYLGNWNFRCIRSQSSDIINKNFTSVINKLQEILKLSCGSRI